MEEQNGKEEKRFLITEDWLSVIIAFLIFLLAAVGVFGENAIQIPF